ncbi:MAG: T9SS type A sorting domain-containing protein [Prevotellaceae bacterium]|nr:T9SS type A sorting domain-containing protein [Prevotellaceae bacterium]
MLLLGLGLMMTFAQVNGQTNPTNNAPTLPTGATARLVIISDGTVRSANLNTCNTGNITTVTGYVKPNSTTNNATFEINQYDSGVGSSSCLLIYGKLASGSSANIKYGYEKSGGMPAAGTKLDGSNRLNSCNDNWISVPITPSDGNWIRMSFSDPDGVFLIKHMVFVTGTVTLPAVSGCGPQAPTVTSSAATGVTTTSGTLNGNVTADGSATITERGFYWSTSSITTPSGQGTKQTVSGTTGAFTYNLTGRTTGTQIWYYAYAINSQGTSYSAVQTFTPQACSSAGFSLCLVPDVIETVKGSASKENRQNSPCYDNNNNSCWGSLNDPGWKYQVPANVCDGTYSVSFTYSKDGGTGTSYLGKTTTENSAGSISFANNNSGGWDNFASVAGSANISLSPGEYIYFFGNDCNPAKLTFTYVPPVCSTPTANAGADKSTTVNTPVALAAGALAANTSGLWTIASGGAGTFSAATSPTSNFTPAATGTYTLTWTVTNTSAGCSAYTANDNMTVTVTAATPSCPAGYTLGTKTEIYGFPTTGITWDDTNAGNFSTSYAYGTFYKYGKIGSRANRGLAQNNITPTWTSNNIALAGFNADGNDSIKWTNVNGGIGGTATFTYYNRQDTGTGDNGDIYIYVNNVLVSGAKITTSGSQYSVSHTVTLLLGENNTVTMKNSNGTAPAGFKLVFPDCIPDCTAPNTPTIALTGSATPCKGTATTSLSVTPSGGTPATYYYKWWKATGDNNTTGSVATGTSNAATYTPPTTDTGDSFYYVQVSTDAAFGTSCTVKSAQQKITVIDKPALPTDFTANAVCAGTTGINYTVTAVGGVSYAWTVTGAGWSITNGANTNSATLTAGTANGTVTVTPTNTCGAGTARTKTVTVNALRTIAIDGNGANRTVCQNSAIGTSIVFNTTGVTAIGTVTGLPDGVTASYGSNKITISGTPTASGTYNYTITPTSVCGTVTATGIITVTAAPAQPSTITGTANVCPNTTGLTYSVTNVASTTYNWTLPTGWTKTAGDNSNSITVTALATAAGNGNISVTATKDGCTSEARTLAVAIKTVTAAVTPATQTKNIETAATALTYAPTLNNGATAGTPQWYENTADSNTGGTLITGETNNTYTPPTTATGTKYYYVVLTDGCGNEVKSAPVRVIVTAQTEPTVTCTTPSACDSAIVLTTASPLVNNTLWNNAPATLIDYKYTADPAPCNNANTTLPDIGGQWQAMYGTDSLYLKVTSNEDVARSAGQNPYDGSNVEINFWFGTGNANNGQNMIAYNSQQIGNAGCNGANAHQIRFGLTGTNANKLLTAANTRAKATDLVGGGYVMELAIPWTTFPAGTYNTALADGLKMEVLLTYSRNELNGPASDCKNNGQTSDYYIGRCAVYRSMRDGNTQFSGAGEGQYSAVPLVATCAVTAPDLTVTNVDYTKAANTITISSVSIANTAGTEAINFATTPATVKFGIGGIWRTATINSGTLAIGAVAQPFSVTVNPITLIDGTYSLSTTVYGVSELSCDNNTYSIPNIVVEATPTPSLSITGTLTTTPASPIAGGGTFTATATVINNGNLDQTESFNVYFKFNNGAEQTIVVTTDVPQGQSITVTSNSFTAPAAAGCSATDYTVSASLVSGASQKTATISVPAGTGLGAPVDVAGPFYIRNWFNELQGAPGCCGFRYQYLRDDETNSFTGGSYTNYNYLKRDNEDTEHEAGANDDRYKWMIQKVTIGTTDYYLLKNVATNRYIHTGYFPATGDLVNNGNHAQHTPGLYEWNNSLVGCATGITGTGANAELSYYVVDFPSSTGTMEDGYSQTYIASKRVGQPAGDIAYLIGENKGANATTYFVDLNNFDGLSTRYWQFIPTAPQQLPDPEVIPSAGNCELTLDWSAYTKPHADHYEVYVYNGNECGGSPIYTNTSVTGKTVTISNAALGMSIYTTKDVSYKVIAISDQGADYNSPGVYWGDMIISCEPVFEVLNPYVAECGVNQITHNSATLGATIVYQGEGSIAQYGTVFNESFNSVKPQTVNAANVNSATLSWKHGSAFATGDTAVFTHSRSTGLAPQTEYYFTGFAVNSFGGKKYSDYGNFYTLSAPVTVSAPDVTTSASTLMVTGVTFPGSGATKGGYLVLYTQTENPLGLIECHNGKRPEDAVLEGISFSLMNEDTLAKHMPAALIPKLPNAKCSETYYVTVIPYTWDGRHYQTYNYGNAIVLAGGKTYAGASYAPYNAARLPWAVGERIEAEDWDFGCDGLLAYKENNGATNTYRSDAVNTMPVIGNGDRSAISLYYGANNIAIRNEKGNTDADREFTQYTIRIADDGYYALRIHAATASNDAAIGVKFLDVNDNSTVLFQSPDNTSVINKGAEYFNNINTRQIYLDKGEYRMRLYYYGNADINVDWVMLEPACFAIVSTNTIPTMTKDISTLNSEWTNTPTVQIQFPVRLQDDNHTVDYFQDYLPAGKWQAKYDEDSVYFYIQVTEDVINTKGGWDGDAIEIYFSPLNGNAAKVCQIGFPVVDGTYATGAIISDGRAAGSEAGYSSFGDADDNKHIPARYLMFKTADGYAMRVNIKWSVIPGFTNFESDIAAANGIPMEVVVSKAIGTNSGDNRDMQIASFSKVRMNAAGNGAGDQLYQNTSLLTKVKFFKTVEDFDPYAAIYKVPQGAGGSYSLEGSVRKDGGGAATTPLDLVDMISDAYTALQGDASNDDLFWRFDIAWREAAEPVNTRHEMNTLDLPDPMYGDKDYYVYTEIKGCQQASGTFHIKFQIDEVIDTIIWTNKTGNGLWKDRQNWLNPNTGIPVNQYTEFSDNLTVIIPAPTGSRYNYLEERNVDLQRSVTVNTDAIKVYPEVTTVADIDSIAITDNLRKNNGGKYIKKLVVEYGGATYISPFVIGDKYENADVEFTIDGEDRDKWVFVGPHIIPNGGVHLTAGDVNEVYIPQQNSNPNGMLSGDFYLNRTPNVYMHELKVTGSTAEFIANWENSFAALDVPVHETTCFAIKIPNDYGPQHKTAAQYYFRGTEAQKVSGDKDITYTWKDTRLANNNAKLHIEQTGANSWGIATNTFLSNISVKKLLEKLRIAADGSTQIIAFRFQEGSGMSVTENDGNFTGSPTGGSFNQCTCLDPNQWETTYIKPMQAFIYQSHKAIDLDESEICVVNNASTHYKRAARSVEGRKPILKVNAYNGELGSEGYVVYNADADAIYNFAKLFSGGAGDGLYSALPDLYFDLNGASLHTETFTSLWEEVKMGIRYGATAGTATLKFAGVDEFDEVYLEDKATNTIYDLYTVDSVNVDIAKGNNADRFVIKFRLDNPIITGEEEVSTTLNHQNGVKIYTEDNQHVTISATDKITDITVLSANGQTVVKTTPKSGSYAVVDLSNYPAGVYVVKAVTETDSATGKVIIK